MRRFLLLCFLAACAGPAWAARPSRVNPAIFINDSPAAPPAGGGVEVGDTSEGMSAEPGTSHVISHVVAGENTYLAVTVRTETNDSVVSVVAASTNMVLRSSATATSLCKEYIYELVSPTAGTIDITVTSSNGAVTPPRIAAITFTGVDQDDPVHAVAQWIGENGYFPTSFHVDIDGVTDGMVFDGFGGSNTVTEWFPASGQTNVMTTAVTGTDVGTSYRTSASGNNIMSWSDPIENGGDVVQIAVSLHPAP